MSRLHVQPLRVAILASLPVLAAAQGSDDVHLAPVVVQALADHDAPSNNYTVPADRSATGLSLSLKDTPQSVSVVTEKQMKDQGLDDVKAVIRQTPGVIQRTWGSGTSGYNTFIARGYTIDNFRVDGMERSGMARRQTLNNIDSAIYELVSVVRGATGLMSGVGDPGAAVAFTRKRPTRDTRFSAEIGTGTWGRYRAVVDGSGPLNADGSLRGRAVIVHDQGGEWQDRADQRRSTLYGVLEYDFGSRTTLRGGLQHGTGKTTGSSMHSFDTSYGSDATGYWATPFGPRDNASAKWAYRKADQTEVFAGLTHQFVNGWTFQGNYSYAFGNIEQLYGVGGTYAIRPNGAARLTGGYWENAPKEHALDLNLSGSYPLFGRKHGFTVGFAYNRYDDYDNPTHGRIVSPAIANIFEYAKTGDIAIPAFTFAGIGGEKSEMTSLYGSTRLNVSDRWAVVAGGRLLNWESRARTLYTKFQPAVQKEHSVLTPFLGASYALTGALSAYASYSTIFNPQSHTDVNHRTLDPEEGKTYEAGIKGEWLNGRLNAGAALFESHKNNVAVADGVDVYGDTYYRSEDGAKTRGWELSTGGEIQPDWYLSASYARAKSKDKDGTVINTDVPVYMVRLFTTYDINARWTVGGSLNWQGKIYDYRYAPSTRDDVKKFYEQKDYAMVDLMARYRVNKQFSIALHANNIFDKHAWTAIGSHSYHAPRNFMVNVRYVFAGE